MMSVEEIKAETGGEVHEIAVGGQRFLLADEGNLYREMEGPVHALVPARREFVAAHGLDVKAATANASPLILGFDESLLPTQAECKFVWENLFGVYKHETLCWYGRARKDDKQWRKGQMLFFVPEQIVSAAHVSVKNDDEIGKFVSIARIIGDMHSHPWGGWQTRSQTDVNDMEEGPGLHAIFSDEAKVVWYASVRGGHKEVARWDVHEVEASDTSLMVTAGGESIKSRMKREKYAGWAGAGAWHKTRDTYTPGKYRGGHRWKRDDGNALFSAKEYRKAHPDLDGEGMVNDGTLAMGYTCEKPAPSESSVIPYPKGTSGTTTPGGLGLDIGGIALGETAVVWMASGQVQIMSEARARYMFRADGPHAGGMRKYRMLMDLSKREFSQLVRNGDL